MPHVYLNGRILDEAQALLPASDRGLLYGDGLFETMRSYGGKVFRLGDHLARLHASAEFFRLTVPADDAQIENAISELMRLDNCSDSYVRITLTRGNGGRLRLDKPESPTMTIVARSLHSPGADHYRSGTKVIISSFRQSSHSPLARHQTLNYMLQLLAKQEAADAGAGGALLLNEHGQATEEASANLFIVRNGSLITPPVHCGLLPGITRWVVMEIARKDGVEVREEPLPAGDLFGADEMFLTSSLHGIMPVRHIDRRPMQTKAPGPITSRLIESYLSLTA